MSKKSPEGQLLDALSEDLTLDEARYMNNYLLPRVNSKKLTIEKARELFRKKFPDSKWMK